MPAHKAAEAILNQNTTISDINTGPTPEQWQKVYDETVQGKGNSATGVAGVGGRRKVWNLTAGREPCSLNRDSRSTSAETR